MVRRRKMNLDDFPGLFDEVDPGFTVTHADERKPEAVEEEKPHAADLIAARPVGEKLRYISFGSGSSGNCAYLGDDRFGILIDAGIEPDKVYDQLERYHIPLSSIGGIILTHDHGDHCRFAYTIVRANRHMRIYCTPKTLNGILRRHSISRRIKDYHQPIFREFPFHLGNFTITPFEVWHDGSDNVGFCIRSANQCFVVATDMGAVSERADFYIRQADHLMIEANYDLNMLIHGTYAEHLKARIISRTGHMDNKATGAYLARIVREKQLELANSVESKRLRNIFLCHLSHDNNLPELALNAVRTALEGEGLTVGDGSGAISARAADIQLSALPRFDATPLLILRND